MHKCVRCMFMLYIDNSDKVTPKRQISFCSNEG